MLVNKYTKISLLIFLLIVVAGGLFYIYIKQIQPQCSKVYTINDEFSFEKLKKSDVYLDDDYGWNFCEKNTWNCDNFYTQQDAQKMLEECAWPNDPDINKLDIDGDGIACESLSTIQR